MYCVRSIFVQGFNIFCIFTLPLSEVAVSPFAPHSLF